MGGVVNPKLASERLTVEDGSPESDTLIEAVPKDAAKRIAVSFLPITLAGGMLNFVAGRMFREIRVHQEFEKAIGIDESKAEADGVRISPP